MVLQPCYANIVQMPAVVDHVFICTTIGAPAADRLKQFGLVEGSPNQHPGQGTACRRFFFRNAMLELLWVADVSEVQSDQTCRTRLWEHWSGAASPFGIILRPAPGIPAACPFPSWKYEPASIPGFSLHIAEGPELEEPMWCYMESGRAPAEWPADRRQPLEHPCGFRDVTGVRIVAPELEEGSLTLAMARAGVITSNTGPERLLELVFDGNNAGESMDFRPDLPLVFRW